MENVVEQLKKDIEKIVGNLISEDEIKDILKKRLTKKEFKYYKLRCVDATKTEMLTELRCDDKRLDDIKKATLLKLKQEKYTVGAELESIF